MKKLRSVYHFCLATLLLILVPAIGFAADPPGIPEGWSDGYVFDNGVRIHYYHATPNPGKTVIVMVHGVTDNGLCWTTLTWKLQDSFDIYMLDTRGHGLSDPFTHSDNGETLMKDVVGFVETMKFEKPILMGHSMGAATVMRVGAEYPELTKAVIMLDPGLPLKVVKATPPVQSAPTNTEKKPQIKQNRLSINMFGNPENLVMQNNYSYDELVETGISQFPKWNLVDVNYWALSKKQYHGPFSSSDWQAMIGTMRTGESLSKIQVPSLVLKADSSPEGRKANEDAVEGMQKVKLVHIDGAAHNLHHDDLGRTVKEIKLFISNL